MTARSANHSHRTAGRRYRTRADREAELAGRRQAWRLNYDAARLSPWLSAAAVALFLAVFAIGALTAGDLGLTWDEPAYLHSARGDPSNGSEEGAASTRQAVDRHAHCGLLPWLAKLIQSGN